jgi:DNA-binding transcriptional ArsR family regulator
MRQKNRDKTGRVKPTAILDSQQRLNILAIAGQREITPSEYEAEEGLKDGASSYHFKVLANAGFLVAVREEQVGGARRVFYRAQRSSFVDDEEFEDLEFKKRRRFSLRVVKAMHRRLIKAARTGTLDRRVNSHLTWDAGHLDQQGFDQAMEILGRTFDELGDLRDEAAIRLEETGAGSIYTTWGLTGFESPPERQPPGGLAGRFRNFRRRDR